MAANVFHSSAKRERKKMHFLAQFWKME